MEIEQNIWGFSPEGEAVVLYTLTNARGAYVRLTNIGAAIVAVGVPDRDGKIEDVCLGFNDFQNYFGDSAYLGKTCGRYANRIARGRFTLDGKEYKLAVNNSPNHLHGGPRGLSEVLWQARSETNRIVFSYISPDGEEHYPGTLGVEVVYDWNDDGELEITFYAKTEQPTVLNLTNHAYFNLCGEGNGNILGHRLRLNASRYLPTDRSNVPTGELAPVAGTPFDFRQAKAIGRDIDADNEQIKNGNGYDHNWVLNTKGDISQLAVRLVSPVSGISLEVYTNEPGIQVY
ncbi:MAG: galactose mutarotase, partial [Rikenellaceae bacterium]|nr:galactose mutarotase [Rikenellaceae bacterium]